MVWKVVKSAQPPVRYRPNSDRRPDIVEHHQSIRLAEKRLFPLNYTPNGPSSLYMSEGVRKLSALESKLARRQYLVNTKLSELHIN